MDARARRGPPGRPRLGLAVLVVNAGSTSLKLHVVEDDDSSAPVTSWGQSLGRVRAVAHRVVHGGARFREPVLIDDDVRREIHELESLAPLHNAPAVRAIAEAEEALPDVPHVAVFDTAFHATIPDEAATYALPQRWRDWGIRRYGFHGLSVQWCAEQVRVSRLVVCHLGGGSSITAVRDGRSVDTTMGFSPLEGVPMTTRSGSVDPGAIVHLLRRHGVDAATLDHELNFESGMKALGGGSGDLREAGDFALDVFSYRVAAAVGAMAVAVDGLDALAFTAGIGENSARVRASVCSRVRFLGVELDEAANEHAVPDCVISRGDVAVHVVKTREELVAARAARALLG
ncbi:MAG: acetate/propionate family kinase [Gaiellaceae bacterium]